MIVNDSTDIDRKANLICYIIIIINKDQSSKLYREHFEGHFK